MSRVTVQATVDVTDVLSEVRLSDIIESLLDTHGSSDIVHELKENDADLMNNVIGDLAPDELVDAVLSGIGPDERTTHGWLIDFRKQLDEACGGPLASETVAKAIAAATESALPGEPLFATGGLEWRQMVENADFHDAKKRCPKGWRLPTLAEAMALGKRLMAFADRWVWLDEEVEKDRVIMFAAARGAPVIGDPNLVGSVVYVRETDNADKGDGLYASGLRWRFAGDHPFHKALAMQQDGWRLPTLAEFRQTNTALTVAELDPAIRTSEDLMAWLGDSKQADDDTIGMWGIGDAGLDTGDARDKGATYLVRAE